MPSPAGTWWDQAAVLWIVYKRDPEPVLLSDIQREVGNFTAHDLENVERIARRLERDSADA